MSRGLGRRQVLLLQALASLDAEHPDHSFSMSKIVARLYSTSPDLIERERQAQDRQSGWRAELEAPALGGDGDSKYLLFLTDVIQMSRRSSRVGRKRERVVPLSVEHDVNPSRCMRALERRGLVVGVLHGWFKLTGLGRDMCRINSRPELGGDGGGDGGGQKPGNHTNTHSRI